VDDEGVVRPGLLFSGAMGVGKTLLGSLVFKARLERQPAVWIKYVDLEDRIRRTYDQGYTGRPNTKFRIFSCTHRS